MTFEFSKLNNEWNAEPNAPESSVAIDGNDVILKFFLNAFQFPAFEEEELGFITFKNCAKYRLGFTNDEGWYLGQCRFSKLLPEWGEFYELSGDKELLDAPSDWKQVSTANSTNQKHYLFYFRDNTFECIADSWEFTNKSENALVKL